MRIIFSIHSHAAIWSHFNPLKEKKEGGGIESTTEPLKLFQTSRVLQPLTEGRAQLCPWNGSTFLKKKKKANKNF